MTEPFSQWIVEDAFSHGRPPLEPVGVQFVADVRPCALMKTRLMREGVRRRCRARPAQPDRHGARAVVADHAAREAVVGSA